MASIDTVIARGKAVAETLPADIVYIGMSLGVLPAQALAQTLEQAPEVEADTATDEAAEAEAVEADKAEDAAEEK